MNIKPTTIDVMDKTTRYANLGAPPACKCSATLKLPEKHPKEEGHQALSTCNEVASCHHCRWVLTSLRAIAAASMYGILNIRYRGLVVEDKVWKDAVDTVEHQVGLLLARALTVFIHVLWRDMEVSTMIQSVGFLTTLIDLIEEDRITNLQKEGQLCPFLYKRLLKLLSKYWMRKTP